MQADRRSLGIDPNGKVVQRDLDDIAADLADVVRIVGQCLHVGEQQELLMAVLKLQAASERAGVMAEMQRSGGAVAGEDDRLDHWYLHSVEWGHRMRAG